MTDKALSAPRLALLLVLVALPVAKASFAAVVKSGTEECFTVKTPAERVSIVTGDFECLDEHCDDSLLTARFMDTATEKSLWQHPDPESGTDDMYGGGSFSIHTPSKPESPRYALCFQYNFNMRQQKHKHNHKNPDGEGDDDAADYGEASEAVRVGFGLHVMKEPRTLEDKEIGPDAQRALQLVDKAADVYEDWEVLTDHFDFLRNREAKHRDLTDATLRRIVRWTILEAFVVIGMATGQVMYWKKLFETRRYL